MCIWKVFWKQFEEAQKIKWQWKPKELHPVWLRLNGGKGLKEHIKHLTGGQALQMRFWWLNISKEEQIEVAHAAAHRRETYKMLTV